MTPIYDINGKRLNDNSPHPHFPNNFDWLTFLGMELIIRYQEGKSIQVMNKNFSYYFEEVEKWNFELKLTSKKGFKTKSIAVNKSGGDISTEMPITDKSSIYLLPPPTRCSVKDALEILLDIILIEERARYEWWDQIKIPGIDEIKKAMSYIDDDISKLKQKRLSASRQLEQLYEYRDLFSADGDTLVDIVKRTLEDIGITTNKTERGAHVDLVGTNIAIEVYGTTDKIDLSNKKLNQLQIYSQSSKKKLVLIANTYKRENPNMRKEKLHFTPEALQVIKSLKICAMTTQKLYEMWRESKSNPNKIEDIKKSIYEAEGKLGS